jgi:DNA-binding SARP family transcriptional activator/basic membrane lipoprotein Med (substrate-binding protein (PBP1-ABC) superfamily)
MQLRVLGPLEVRLGDDRLALGGAKQRAVLAVLLLRAGEVVSVERLVDEVWGDEPPPSAARSLESYVSRLRQLFNGHGPALVRRGAGYTLELRTAELDAQTFAELNEQAGLAAAEEDHERVVWLTAAALDLWCGPAFADVVLASAGRAEAERLEELRLCTYELGFDAKLALGCHEQVVGELQALVRQNPYRERFVAQLMLALYRSGRHAEALDAYEQTRRRLDDDLGLQPSAELRALSGQIVRQDSALERPLPDRSSTAPRRAFGSPAGRFSGALVAGVVTAATMALSATGSVSRDQLPAVGSSDSVTRVALVLPTQASVTSEDARITSTTAEFRRTADRLGYEQEILVADEVDPSPAQLERTVDALAQGGYRLVLVSGAGATAQALAPLVRRQPETRFVFLDAYLSSLSLDGVPNATGIPYADHESARLVGYLGGLVPRRGDPQASPVDVVSVIAAPRTPRNHRIVRGFARGVHNAQRDVAVRVAYVADPDDKTRCEALANAHVDAGADVVFAIGRPCSTAALTVARMRGVWGIRVGGDATSRGPHIMASTWKVYETAVAKALNGYSLDTLPAGRDVTIGLADDYAVIIDADSHAVSEKLWSKVVRLCSSIRQHAAQAP